jgi:hypothetical protein
LAVVFALLLASVRAKCPGSLSQVQYDALEKFYNSAGGPYWIFDFDFTKWTFPSSLSAPCTIPWEGINCTWSSKAHTECLVVSIELEYMNMSGTLSPYLGNLTSLQMLVLPNNTLSGPDSSARFDFLCMVDVGVFPNYEKSRFHSRFALSQVVSSGVWSLNFVPVQTLI